MELHEKIYHHRKQLGLSQEELAQRLGVTRQAISKWELGTSQPELESLVALAKVFQVSTDYLLDSGSSAHTPQKDWLDRLPGFLGKLFRKYGWLIGVYIAVTGGLFAALGGLGRYMSKRMFSGFGREFDIMFSGLDALVANNPVTVFATGVMIFGLVLMVIGVILAIVLKRRKDTKR